MVCAAAMITSMGASVYADEEVKATGDEKIALITMDSIDQHWITLNEGAQADGTVNPECSTTAQGCVHRRERESQRTAAYPKGKGTGGHGYSTYTVGEDFSQQCPCDRAKRHGIDGDGSHNKPYHQYARHTHIITSTKSEINEAQATRTQ